jgi:hypothetical protein
MQVEIYGHSDDCLEVEGGKLTDEFPAYGKAKFLHFNDGTIIEAEYGPECDEDYRWRIRPVKTGNGTAITRVDGTCHGEDEGAICDRLILFGDFSSVKCFNTAEGPDADDLETFFDNFDYRDLTPDQAKRVMAICDE